jgi:hypothetical protein
MFNNFSKRWHRYCRYNTTGIRTNIISYIKTYTCIISSKDFVFLHKRTRFVNILSCVLGIEAIIHNSHYNSNNNKINNSCIRCQELIANSHSLMDNSKLLRNVVEILRTHNYKDIIIEEKYL